jgi:parallel beta-helix repeat protein
MTTDRERINQRNIQPSGLTRRLQFSPEQENLVVVYPIRVGKQGAYTDIQGAVDRIKELGGGTVFISSGTHRVTSDITLYSGVSLVGENSQRSILDFIGEDRRIVIDRHDNDVVTNVVVRDLKITNRVGISQGAIYINDSDSVRIENNYFYGNTGSYDIYVGSTSNDNLVVAGNLAESGTSFLYVNDSNPIEITSNVVRTYTSNAIYLVGAVVSVSNNTFSAITGDVIKVEDLISEGRIYSNYLLNCGADGFDLGGTENTVIMGNYIDGTTGSTVGIKLEGAVWCIVSSNQVKSFGGDGIDLGASDECVLNGNILYNNGGYGIDIPGATAVENLVTSNVFSGNSSGGLNDAGTSTTKANNITT